MPASPRRNIGALMIVLAALSGCEDPTLRLPRPYHLVEKGPYQSLYGRDGKIERILYDRDDDRIADAIILYDGDGKVLRAEIDTDLDHVVDRWEYFDRGALVRLGFTRRTPGVPDQWDVVTAAGTLTQREYDDDGDGAVDRSEPVSERQ